MRVTEMQFDTSNLKISTLFFQVRVCDHHQDKSQCGGIRSSQTL
jgi:hypothetical protein